MNPIAAAPAPPAAPPTPERPARHTGPADLVAFRALGEPLPCLCPSCRERLARWEGEREASASCAETLPPAFWTRQAVRLQSARRGFAPRRAWALAPAAGLLLAIALFVLPARSGRAPDDFEARWSEVQEALERPALGDLEACAVLLDEGENTTLEESL
jgi:hypothetical protein